MGRKGAFRVWCTVLLVAVFTAVNAQGGAPVPGTDPYVLPSQVPTSPPRIDGVIDAGEYPDAARREGFWDMGTAIASDEVAEFWLTSDAQFLYFAVRVRTDPTRIVDDEYRQNVSLGSNDNMRLMVDVFGTGRSANVFAVNARGATSIFLSGGRAAKTEWLGEFEASGRKTETGWQAEAKIPWSTMALPSAGPRDLLFNVLWYRSNKSNTYEWKPARGDFRNSAKWAGVPVPSVERVREIKVLPYAVTGIDEDGGLVADTGFDFKTALGSDLEFVGTVNPDFRNVEQGVLSLDFSYFERLVDDARPFFQEGAEYRSTGFDQRLFASQRIDRIDGGVNVYGNLGGKTQVGFLGVTDVGNQTATTLAVNQALTAKDSVAFAHVANRQRDRNSDAFQLNFDRSIPGGTLYFNSQLTEDQVRKTGTRLSTGVWKGEGGWGRSLEYNQVTRSFFPRIGFSPERDLRGVRGSVNREVQPKSGPILTHFLSFDALYYDRFNGDPYRREFEIDGFVGLRSGHFVSADINWSRFEDSADRQIDVTIGWPSSNPYRRWRLGYTAAQFDGSAYDEVSLSAAYRPINQLQLNASSQFVRFRGFRRQHVLSFNWDTGRFEAIGGRVVNRGDDWNWYASYRLSGRRGNEVFLILGDPNSRTFTRQLLVKVLVPVSVRL